MLIGGSAGSLDELLRFFALLPGNCGIAFVVAIHLSPNDESSLAELIQRRTALRVLRARDGQLIRVNHVYVIPPARLIKVADSRLVVIPRKQLPGVRTVVDELFKSVANQAARSMAGIVLSGADSDGAAGLQQIKRQGGLALVQSPKEAVHETMPRAALAAGSVDAVLLVAEMPARLVAYFGQTATAKSPRIPPAVLRVEPKPMTRKEQAFLREALACLRESTGRDWSYFRDTVLWRYLRRRMVVTGVEERDKYLAHLRRHAGEAKALVRDLLVSVTRFFRDPRAFEALGRFLPELFRGKGPEDFVRVWVPGCATGEEAYSVAILLLEHASTLPHPPGIQVFGSDLDAEAIETARSGIYRTKSASALGPERLARFFQQEARGFRVGEELRRVVLLTVHDVVKVPSFARMDLVSCRNLLIYLSPEARERLLEVFEFALNSHGLLLLGSSESLEGSSGAFEPLDFKHRIYRRSAPRPPVDARAILEALVAEQHARGSARQPCTPAEDRSIKLLDQLQAGIDSLRRRLQAPEQPPDPAKEALRAANQEVEAINQELRATAQELEVNRQELRCMNEELSAVNHELSVNVDDLAQANNDLTNLMNAIAIPTLFLDRGLRLMRYTPAATTVFSLLPSDAGRSVASLRHQLDYPELLEDLRRVLAKTKPIQAEVRGTAGRWFASSIVPYRTAQAKVSGVVLTLYDITDRKRAEAALRVSEQRARIQKEAFQASVNGEPLVVSLNILTRIVKEELGSEVRTAFYIAYPDGASLHAIDGAGDMQQSYTKPVDGFLVGDKSFACGLAIATARPVLTRDVFEEPEWESYVHLAKEHHFRSCGSYPIMTRQGKAIGTFAMYFKEVRDATPQDIAVADAVTSAAAIIISRTHQGNERARAETALREGEGRQQPVPKPAL